MGALFPSEVTVLIGAAGAASSSCTAFTTRLTNFSETGGDRDSESIPVFGNGNIVKESPASQIEVSFDAILQYSDVLLFDQLVASSVLDGSTLVESKNEGTAKVVYVQWYDGTSYHTRAYNNARAVMFEPEMSADEYLKGTITFKLAPTTEDSTPKSNRKLAKAAASTITWS